MSPIFHDKIFQSTRPSRDGTGVEPALNDDVMHFNPPVPRGTGPGDAAATAEGAAFQSTRPSRDGTGLLASASAELCISIHPSLAGRDLYNWSSTLLTTSHFNPPVPRGTGLILPTKSTESKQISIHPSLAGRDGRCAEYKDKKEVFQSTRPSRDGTEPQTDTIPLTCDFNPPVPRGTGRTVRGIPYSSFCISIHPSLAGRDRYQCAVFFLRFISIHPSLEARQTERNFNPPVPRGTGLGRLTASPYTKIISIHPSLAGRDPIGLPLPVRCLNFNPPVPRGTGHVKPWVIDADQIFQSTRPSRDGTELFNGRLNDGHISIHPSLAGRDAQDHGHSGQQLPISIHPSLAGRDRLESSGATSTMVFQSTRPSRDGTPTLLAPCFGICYFNPPVPRGTGRQKAPVFTSLFV